MKSPLFYISKFKNQIMNLSIYMLAAMIPMLLSLLANPFIAKNLSPTDYAIVGYYTAFNTLFGPFVNFYLLHYYTKRFYELDENERLILKSTIFRALIYLSFILALIVYILLYIYTTYFNTNSQIPFLPYSLLAVLYLPLTGIYSLQLTEYRMERKSKDFFNLSVTNGVLGVIMAVLFVVVFKWGADGRMWATFLVTLSIFIYVFIKNRHLLKIKFDHRIFKVACKFCFPLVIASMLTFFSSGYDKVLLERAGDIATLGIYSVGATIASYLHIFSTSINDTFQPDIFKSIAEKNMRKCFNYVILKLSIMAFCVICFIILAPYIIDILTFGRYVNSTKFASILAVSSLTSMLYYTMSQITVALGYTTITLWNKIIGSILSIISFSLLIPKFGAIGAAWGVVLSYIYFFIGNVFMIIIKHKPSK